MAIVTLMNSETDPGILPKVCCRCGMPADAEKRVNFSWTPPWTLALIAAGILIYIIVAAILRKSRVVYLPVCEEHNSYWKAPELFLVLSLLGTIAGSVGAGMVLAGNPNTADYVLVVVLGAAVWFVVSLVIGIIWQQRYVRVTEITDREIRLKNIHPNFVDALEQDRDRDWDEHQARKHARRKQRDENEDSDVDNNRSKHPDQPNLL